VTIDNRTTPKDESARRRIREELDSTMVVEAAAGTGKTTALVRRIAALLRSGRARLDSVALVTFTDKAAGEIKLRLRSEIERLRLAPDVGDDERRHLESALAALETANIGTIHSFCLDLLRERPIEAGIDPAIEVTADTEPLIVRAFDSWYQSALDAPPEGLRRILRSVAGSRTDGPRAMLLGAVRDLVDRRDFSAPWRRDPFDRNAAIDTVVARVVDLVALVRLGSPNDTLVKKLDDVVSFAERLAEREQSVGRDYDSLEHELIALARSDCWSARGSGQWFARELERATVLAQRTEVEKALDDFSARAEADLAACLQRELMPVLDAYEREKHASGVLDYLDMLLRVRDMLRDHRDVRAALQRRFTHLFVDEFQDTDPLQAEILLLLSADDPDERRAHAVRPVPGKLFVVGDPKQSIYRFRRADVALYRRIKEQLLRAGAVLVHLTETFRGLPTIVSVVNQAFEAKMCGPTQPDYVAMAAHRRPHGDQPQVVALPVPDPYSEHGNFRKDCIRASLAQAVVAFVRWLVRESGWTVSERTSDGEAQVPIEPRHVCLMFRNFRDWSGDLTRPYVRELENRGIAHVLVGGQAFHAREEILALRTALRAIEWPRDELYVYATLRGPLFSFSDDRLFEFCHAAGARRHLDPLRRWDEADLDERSREVVRALEVLRKLHFGRNDRPIAATLMRLLAETRAHAALAIWPSGEQALANVQRLLEQARRYEKNGATSFRGFLEALNDEADRGQGSEAPVVEEGADGVRITTVHAAKGLEFPVVVLCDPERSKHEAPSRYIDPEQRLWAFRLAGCTPIELLEHAASVREEDRAEELRVAYVAATRARDLMVVPVFGDALRDGWFDVLHDAVYPERGSWRAAEIAPRTPPFRDDSVRKRPARVEARPDECVKPGLHRVLGNDLVWWDPNVLELDVPSLGGLGQMELLRASDERSVSDDVARAHQSWRERLDATVALGKRASVTARSITALAASSLSPTAPGPEVRWEQVDIAREGRPSGARFGTLVHMVLAELPIGAAPADVEVLASAAARAIAATNGERDAARDAVVAALANPLWCRAGAAHRRGDLRREEPVMFRLEDGTIAEGVIDLAFREQDGEGARWFVVDFKSDGPTADATRAAHYAAQVGLYCRAVTAATGAPAEGILLWV
jgi:ATP-dependent exoDNAse (exonuclease V) beta subunit